MPRLIIGLPPMLSILLLTAPAFGDEGRIPIFASPNVIGAPGKYFLTRNLTAAANGPMIDVRADNVDIDLNGFTLNHTGFFGATINAIDVDRLSVRNGKIEIGNNEGIRIENGRQVVIEDVKTFGGLVGINLFSVVDYAIRRNAVMDAGAVGILGETLGLSQGTIEGNQIANSGWGIQIQGGRVAVLNNRLTTFPSGRGISLESCIASIVSGNTIDGSNGDGIHLGGTRDSKVLDNVISSRGNGIFISETSFGNLILSNVVGDCLGHGLLGDGYRNHIGRNVLNSNQAFGLIFSTLSRDNTFGRNTARGNVGVFPACTGGGLAPPNSCDQGVSNSSFGDNLIPGPPVM